jgi:hypothetical protein
MKGRIEGKGDQKRGGAGIERGELKDVEVSRRKKEGEPVDCPRWTAQAGAIQPPRAVLFWESDRR